MNNLLLLISIFFSLIACETVDDYDADNFNEFGQKITFVIENNLNEDLSDIKIFLTNDDEVFTSVSSLTPNEKKEVLLDMASAQNMDGSYSVSYVVDGNVSQEEFGYYSNGFPLEEELKLKIDSTGISIE